MLTRYAVRCRAPLWARGGQAQTLLGYFLPVTGEALDPALPDVERHELQLDGEDRVVVFEAAPADAAGGERPLDGAVVHLFHGLTGSSDSNYVRLAASVMRGAGARVVAYNHRGQGAGAGLARGFYHSGSDLDLFASVGARARGIRARRSWPSASPCRRTRSCSARRGAGSTPDCPTRSSR